MAKCPWCGEDVREVASPLGGYFAVCGSKRACFVSRTFATKSEALAAASKRFMPKRTVEEIMDVISREFIARDKSASAMLDGMSDFTDDERSSSWRLATVKMFHKVSDFITGANE